MSSRFASVKVVPPLYQDILHDAFTSDVTHNKIDLSSKMCRNEDGSTWTLKEVKKIELHLANDPKMNHEYFHPLGHQQFRDAAVKFLLGDNSEAIQQGRTFGVQTVGGNSGLWLAMEFLNRQMDVKRFYTPSPTSDDQTHVFTNHRNPMEKKYPYWDPIARTLDFEGMIGCLKRAEKESVVVLQMCGHSPTGCDPTKDQWVQIADVMQERHLFPLFDASYQGLSSGDPDEDAWPVRYFADRGFELLCSQSFSTNLGLYGCRIGNLTYVARDSDVISTLLNKSSWNTYNIFGNPVQHGAKIVLAVLEDSQIYSKWFSSLNELSARLRGNRLKLCKSLISLNNGEVEDMSHIAEQTGLFSYLGLTEEQVEYLREHHHIYLDKDGVLNVSALNSSNIGYVATCIHQAMIEYPSDDINNNNMKTPSAYVN